MVASPFWYSFPRLLKNKRAVWLRVIAHLQLLGLLFDRAVTVKVKDSAIFSTWIALKKTLDGLASEFHIVLALSDTFLVDHTTMSKFHEMKFF